MEYTDPMKNRLKRLEGQLRGILKMIEEGKDCRDVVTQLSACRTAIDRTIGLIVGKNLEECIKKQMEEGDLSHQKAVEEAVNMLVKSR
ncbi:metal-sensitive transcriptional regulator [Fictibacillus fluitans]|uniref:Metal-sensitive transcriptional regulator n=1 Tax=Fictibacillus fluitans TaxID=3058422 RepID=A0ABT8HRE5_9BACL|nr:metal-sensitive transcriptional regulator [Fictibacillus sp. NE201]MDN4523349.1 metal-sensitive transcriptional regulator [Fictibacillus sp. NE201]